MSLAARPRLALHMLAWALTGVLVAVLLHALAGLAWPPALAFAVPLAVSAAPASLSGFYLSRALPLAPGTVVRVASTSLLAAVVTGSIWAAVGQLWWRALQASGLPAVAPGPPQAAAVTPLVTTVFAMAYAVSMALHYAFRAYENAAHGERRALESEVAAREAELRALRAQIDPHFLFNSLNSIAGLTGVDPAAARSMCQKLGTFLRDSLALGGAGRIPLGREIALVRQYLEIEHVRFGERLTVQATVGEGAELVSVPALLLQPLVENAVRHGIAGLIEGGTVEVLAVRAADRVVVTVSNPRDPEAAPRPGTRLGLDIVRRRLAAAFGADAAMTVEPTADAYRVILTMPAGDGEGTA